MTGPAFPTGFRHICRKSAATLKNENVADRSKQCKRSKRQFDEGKNRANFKRMYFSDESEWYETTASQDERIEQTLQQENEKERSRQISVDSERKEAFEEAFQEKTHEIFHLAGLTFLKFTHRKIKFCFEPRKVVTFVNKKIKFYCSLKYYEKYKIWNIRRDSFPVNYKARIYSIFYGGEYFSVNDDTVAGAILRIYLQLKFWAKEEEEYRQEKFMRYQNGEDIILDSDDEELFLTEGQKQEIHNKRDRLLSGMIPPPGIRLIELPPERTRKRRKQTRRRRRQIVISDSE